MPRRRRQQPFDAYPPEFYEIPPPRPWRARDPWPNIIDMETFGHVHRRRDDLLKRYLQHPRHNYQTLPLTKWEYMLSSNRHLAGAFNCEARIALAGIAVRHLLRSDITTQGLNWWITIKPASCVVPLAQAAEFDPRKIIALTRNALADIPFIAVVEAAHYWKWGPTGPSLEDHVSFHTHVLALNRTRQEVHRALESFLERHRDMFGRSPAYTVVAEPDELEWKFLYALKGQTKTYRARAKPGEHIDSRTGEVIAETWQSKDWMRTGDHVKMLRALAELPLDQLIFGNGVGTQLARAIRYEFMQPFCRFAEPFNDEAKQAGEPIPYPVARTYRAIGNRLRRETEAASHGEAENRADAE